MTADFNWLIFQVNLQLMGALVGAAGDFNWLIFQVNLQPWLWQIGAGRNFNWLIFQVNLQLQDMARRIARYFNWLIFQVNLQQKTWYPKEIIEKLYSKENLELAKVADEFATIWEEKDLVISRIIA